MNEPTIINNNLEKTINNLREPKINNNISNEQLSRINNLEEPKINNNILNEQPTKISNNTLEKSNIINNLEEPKIIKIVKTPEFLISKKVLLNPLTTDNKSFLDSITVSLHHKTTGKNNCRPKKMRKYSDTFCWKNINFSPTEED